MQQVGTFQPGIDVAGPVVLAENSCQSNGGTEDQGRERPGTGTTAPVQSQCNDHACPGPDGTGDHKEHGNVVNLGKEQTEEEDKDRHPGNRDTQGPQLLFRRERLFRSGTTKSCTMMDPQLCR